MSEITDLVVMRDSEEAARLVTLTGWVSRLGHFYGDDERIARYDGCTHVRCDCGNITEKHWLMCEVCRHKQKLAKYDALPVVEWDGKTPLCTYDDDEYFFDEDSVYDYCDEHGCKVEDLLLVLCEPVYAREISADGCYEDDIPPDMTLEDVAPELAYAFDKLNEFIRNYKKPLSWVAGEKRVVLEEREAETQ